MERQLIKAYDNFLLMGVFRNGTLLYKEADPLPLPTEHDNYKIICGFDKPIEVTDEEKIVKKTCGRKKLPDSVVIEIRQMLTKKSVTKDFIRKRFNISPNTLKKIEQGLVYQHLIDSKEFRV